MPGESIVIGYLSTIAQVSGTLAAFLGGAFLLLIPTFNNRLRVLRQLVLEELQGKSLEQLPQLKRLHKVGDTRGFLGILQQSIAEIQTESLTETLDRMVALQEERRETASTGLWLVATAFFPTLIAVALLPAAGTKVFDDFVMLSLVAITTLLSWLVAGRYFFLFVRSA